MAQVVPGLTVYVVSHLIFGRGVGKELHPSARGEMISTRFTCTSLTGGPGLSGSALCTGPSRERRAFPTCRGDSPSWHRVARIPQAGLWIQCSGVYESAGWRRSRAVIRGVCRGSALRRVAHSSFCTIYSGLVAVGFMPAFKNNQRILLEVPERGHKAHGYVHSRR